MAIFDIARFAKLLPGSPAMHVGFIVPNLDRAMDQYRDLFGWKWTTPVRVQHELDGPCAAQQELYVAFSAGSPMVELIEDRPGSLWSGDRGALHHLGCWVSDLEDAGRALDQQGFEFCARGRRVGAKRFAYAIYRRDGFLLEIQDSRFAPGWRAWLETAK
jgi:catechol 2,3-dioxygenase-like lactoylglutathione lyase family enzyme